MASALDDAVGQVVHTLKDQGLYEDNKGFHALGLCSSRLQG